MYYYLGLEARQSENIYNDYSEALDDAKYIATRLLLPIRIFQMTPDKRSKLVEVIQPNKGRRPLHKKTFLEGD